MHSPLDLCRSDNLSKYNTPSAVYYIQGAVAAIRKHCEMNNTDCTIAHTHIEACCMHAHLFPRPPPAGQVRDCYVRLSRHHSSVSLQPLLKACGETHLHSMNTNDCTVCLELLEPRLPVCNQHRKSSERDLGHYAISCGNGFGARSYAYGNVLSGV